MIRALFFDLDGTLLTSQKQIPPSAKQAIMACRRRGMRVFFASARSPRLDQTLDWTEEEFSLFDGGIYSNGASVDYGGKFHYCYIDSEAVAHCLQAARDHDVHLSLHVPGDGYAFNFPVDACMEKGWGLKNARLLSPEEAMKAGVVKILLFYDHLTDAVRPLPEGLVRQVREACGKRARVYVTDAGRTVQLSGLDAGKVRAIERIRIELGLEKDEIAVFGDDINDLDMIREYPNSVAMGNGCEEVKCAARFITKENDRDGVQYALEKLLG